VSTGLATSWQLHCPVNTTASGDTSVTGVNLNRKRGKTSSSTCYQDETTNVQANVIAQGNLGANGSAILLAEGTIILGYLDCIAVDMTEAVTTACVTFRGYYHTPE